MTEEQELYFLMGYLYRMALQLKEDGNFNDLSAKEIMRFILEIKNED